MHASATRSAQRLRRTSRRTSAAARRAVGVDSREILASAQGNSHSLSPPSLAQTRVPPNARIEGNVTVSNNAATISPLDPDVCETATPLIGGHFVTVEVRVDGRSVYTERKCISGLGGSKTYQFSFPAPSNPGQYAVDVEARMANSGNGAGQKSTSITVEEEAPAPGDDNPACNSFIDALTTPNCSPGDVIGGALGGPALGAGALMLLLLVVAVAA